MKKSQEAQKLEYQGTVKTHGVSGKRLSHRERKTDLHTQCWSGHPGPSEQCWLGHPGPSEQEVSQYETKLSNYVFCPETINFTLVQSIRDRNGSLPALFASVLYGCLSTSATCTLIQAIFSDTQGTQTKDSVPIPSMCRTNPSRGCRANSKAA